MGDFKASCTLSRLSIRYGDNCLLFPLILSKHIRYRKNHIEPTNMFLYPDSLFELLCFPIKGIYDDYGSIEEIEHNDNTNAIEKYFNMSIEDFVYTLTKEDEDIKHSDVSLKYYFEHMDLLDEKISFEDFLLGLGFVKEDNLYTITNSYSIVEDNNKYFFVTNDDEIEINEYYCKYELLNLHKKYCGKYLGIKNKKQERFSLLKQLFVMFMLDEVYEHFTKPYDIDNYDEISLSMLLNIGYNPKNDENLDELIKDNNIYILDKNRFHINQKEIYWFSHLNDEDKNIISSKDKYDFLYEDLFLAYKYNVLLPNDFFDLDYDEWKQQKKQIMGKIGVNTYHYLEEIKECSFLNNHIYFKLIYSNIIKDGKLRKDYINLLRLINVFDNTKTLFQPSLGGYQVDETNDTLRLSQLNKEIIEKRQEEDEEW